MSDTAAEKIERLVEIANGCGTDAVRAEALEALRKVAPHLIQPECHYSAQPAMPQSHFDFCQRTLRVIEDQEQKAITEERTT